LSLIANDLPCVRGFIEELNAELISGDGHEGLTNSQKDWLSFCMIGAIVTNSLCWAKFERATTNNRSKARTSYMFCNSSMPWDLLYNAGIRCIFKKYKVKTGRLILDDTDCERSKNTTAIFGVHKQFDKKTTGYHFGQNIMFLVLVSDEITLPVGHRFFIPDSAQQIWKIEDKDRKLAGQPKGSMRPKPSEDPKFPSKHKIALDLLKEFKVKYPNIVVTLKVADAAFCSAEFIEEVSKIDPDIQFISILRGNQLARYSSSPNAKWKSLDELFKDKKEHRTTVKVRGGKEQEVILKFERLYVKKHKEKRFVVLLKYNDDMEGRYLCAIKLRWRPDDVAQGYSFRWLVEVVIQDWEGNSGWGSFSTQQQMTGATHSVVLSLLVDLIFLAHSEQTSQVGTKNPLNTAGSLRESIRSESLIKSIEEFIAGEDHDLSSNWIAKLKDVLTSHASLRKSSKHMNARSLDELHKPTRRKRTPVETS
jgi:hypothetical protein